jgi:8-oxo-dGTP pyrophosphatase MutT (NUDIX family)
MTDIQKFQVSLKGCLVRDRRLLMVRDPASRSWELPGGRIDVGEEATPATEILTRELLEELGDTIGFTIGAPVMTWVRPLGEGFVFLIGYRCRVTRGEPRLSAEHDDLCWVTDRSWRDLSLAPGYVGALEAFWSSSKR